MTINIQKLGRIDRKLRSLAIGCILQRGNISVQLSSDLSVGHSLLKHPPRLLLESHRELLSVRLIVIVLHLYRLLINQSIVLRG